MWRGLIASARAGVAASAWLKRSVDGVFEALARLVAQFARLGAGAIAAVIRGSAWLALRAVLLGAKLAVVTARFVWRHVFRLFALSGTLAALSVTAWAVQSMRAGRSIGQALSEIAGPAAAAMTLVFAVLSATAALAAIALALRHAPPRLLRAAGLAGLLLLVLAPTPFIAHWVWTSAAVQTGLGEARAAAGVLAANAGQIGAYSGIVGLALVGLAAAAALFAALWRCGRRVPARVWGKAIALAAAAGVIGIAGFYALQLVSSGVAARTADAARTAASSAFAATMQGLAAAAPVAAQIASILVAALLFSLLIIRLWRALGMLPPQAWRRAALAGGLLAAAAGLAAAGFLLWRSDGAQSLSAGLDEPAQRIERAQGTPEPPIGEPEPEAAPSPAAPPEEAAPPPSPEREAANAPAEQGAAAAAAQPAALGMPEVSVVFPPRPMHWRFGSAELVGDGLTAFERISDVELIPPEALCGFDAVIAIGAASSEGAPEVNADLAHCRAMAVAEQLSAARQACDGGAPIVMTADLGSSRAQRPDAEQRPLAAIGVNWGSGVEGESAILRSTVDHAHVILDDRLDPAEYAAIQLALIGQTNWNARCRDLE